MFEKWIKFSKTFRVFAKAHAMHVIVLIKNESGSKDIFIQFEKFSNVHTTFSRSKARKLKSLVVRDFATQSNLWYKNV